MENNIPQNKVELINKVKDGIRGLHSIPEIAYSINRTVQTVYNLIRDAEKAGIWLSEEEEKEIERQKEEMIRIEDKLLHFNIIKLRLKRFPTSRIAEILHYSGKLINSKIREYKDEGCWIPPEIDKIITNGELFPEDFSPSDYLKSIAGESYDEESGIDNPELLKYDELLKRPIKAEDIKKYIFCQALEFKANLPNNFEKALDALRAKARYEYKNENTGKTEEIKYRKTLIETLIGLKRRGVLFKNSNNQNFECLEIEMILKTVCRHSELFNDYVLRYIISKCLEIGLDVEKILNILINSIHDKEYSNKLKELCEYAKYRKPALKILEKRNEGFEYHIMDLDKLGRGKPSKEINKLRIRNEEYFEF